MYDCSGTHGTSVCKYTNYYCICVRTADAIIDARGNDPFASFVQVALAKLGNLIALQKKVGQKVIPLQPFGQHFLTQSETTPLRHCFFT